MGAPCVDGDAVRVRQDNEMNDQQLENELWEAADQLRANSKLTAVQYAMPVLGLIFLRHASNRFAAYLPEIEADIPARVPAAQREQLIKLGFQGKAAIYLPEDARFERIASLPAGADVGAAIDHAMDVIEAEYEVLAGALPRGYAAFEPDLLADLVKIFDRPAIRTATGDVFGRIYEYFLNKFAMNSAQEGGAVRRNAFLRQKQALYAFAQAATRAGGLDARDRNLRGCLAGTGRGGRVCQVEELCGQSA